LSFAWPSGIPQGTYTIFMALLRPGAIANNTLGVGDVIAVAATEVTFNP
jgi:hypothetical protein